MPRTADNQLEDHYQFAFNAHHAAVTRFDPGDREYDSLMLEGILHALLDLGVGVAELTKLLHDQGEQLEGQAAAAERLRSERWGWLADRPGKQQGGQ